MNICEYTTLASAKSTYTDIISGQSDAQILSMIRQASREIEAINNRHFYPRLETHFFDTPRTPDLLLDDDLLEVTTLTNGSGAVIPSSAYKLYPLNKTPHHKLTLLPSSASWLTDGSGNTQGAVSLTGAWGYSPDYASAWELDTALSAAIATTTATTAQVPAFLLHPGDLLKIDSEFVYVISLSTTAATDTLTLTRGVNGSSAAAHLQAAPVYRWNPGSDLSNLINRAVAAYTKLRANPLSESVSVDGMTFNTPRDVTKYLAQQSKTLGLSRTGLA